MIVLGSKRPVGRHYKTGTDREMGRMERNEMIMTDTICEAVLDEVLKSGDYAEASVYLESEIIQLLGNDEDKWSQHNDAYAALENSIVREAVKIGYSLGLADKKSIEHAATL